MRRFCLGSAVSWDGRFNTATEDQVFSHVIDFVMNCACFIYIGAWLPFQAYDAPEVGLSPWKLVVLLIFILAMSRIPFLLLLYKFVPDVHDLKEALFCGHFGRWRSASCLATSYVSQGRWESVLFSFLRWVSPIAVENGSRRG